jgi:hypothetical protein
MAVFFANPSVAGGDARAGSSRALAPFSPPFYNPRGAEHDGLAVRTPLITKSSPAKNEKDGTKDGKHCAR